MATPETRHPAPAEPAPVVAAPAKPELEAARFFDLTLDPLAIASLDGVILRANAAWEDVLGWRAEELAGRRYLELIHPADRESTAREAERLAGGGETRDFEMRWLTREGGWRWMTWSAHSSPQEGVLYAVGKDITERKASEAALREAEERFRSLTESVDDAIVSADDGGRIVFWNAAAREMFGWRNQDVYGQPLTLLMPERFRSPHDRGFARLQATGETKVIGSTVELAGQRADGEEFPLELSLGRWSRAGRTYYTGAIRDVSERHRAQSCLAAQYAVSHVLAENPTLDEGLPALLSGIGTSLGWSVGGFWVQDGDHSVECAAYWSTLEGDAADAFRQASERPLQLGEGLPGRVWTSGEPAWVLDVLSDTNFPRAPAARAAGLHGAVGLPVISGGEVIAVMEFFSSRIRQPDDALVEMMSTVSTQAGQFLRRKQAESALHRASRELHARAEALERSNSELEQFAYVASHDLSEPLRQVSGFVQLLSQRYRGRLDSDADEFIDFTVDGVERMQELIGDLLAYSRVGRSGREDGPIDLRGVVARACSALASRADERSARIEIAELPVVMGEESELVQLFQNLISNGLKFCEDTPHVRVSAGPTGGRWEISVEDNGIGVEPRHAERIFKMFQRLHGRAEYPGTGIGLTICKKIVERQGGEIGVAPSPLGGSAFTFTLPAVPAHGPAAGHEEKDAP